MAKGLEVLEAALAGSWIGIQIHAPGMSELVRGWYQWCPDCQTFERAAPGHSPKIGITIHELWHENWLICTPTRSFHEAILAMNEGLTFWHERDHETPYLYRKHAGRYEMTYARDDDIPPVWTEAVFSSEDIDATDWREA